MRQLIYTFIFVLISSSAVFSQSENSLVRQSGFPVAELYEKVSRYHFSICRRIGEKLET